MMNLFLSLFVAVLVFNFLLERLLAYLNSKRFSTMLPAALQGIYDADKYKISQEYLSVKHHFATITSAFSFALTLVVLYTGLLGYVDALLTPLHLHPIVHALIFFGIIGLISDILNTPFDVYATFVIEARFGFNKTSYKTFILDKLKGWLLGAIIGGVLLAAIIWFYETTGNLFWIYTWMTISAFMIFMVMFYSDLIVPLFNKQAPLEDGELRTAIESFGSKAGFKIDNIFVIDGSKRSSKANAYFSGLGAKKRIVLYDTLIKNHTTEELVAVLAHEIGHYKLKHTRTGIVLSIAQTGIMLYVLSLFIAKDSNLSQQMATALGAAHASFHIGIIGFAILYSPLSLLIGLAENTLSRHNEFEADTFAGTYYNADALQSALKKLSVDNLSNLQPHPAYVFFYYSHPPLLERLKNLSVIK